MEEEKKVIIHLKKKDLASDRAEKREKRRKIILLVVLCLMCSWVGYSFAFLQQHNYHDAMINSTGNKKLDSLKTYLSSVWLYKDEYENIDEQLDDQAYYGMTHFADDPYTTYMSAEELNNFSRNINMSFVGIGVSYFNNAGISTITQVFKDSPAANAGIEVGDILLAVDGKDIRDMEAEEIRQLVLGKEGSSVQLLIRREAEEKNISVIRGKVDTTVFAEKKGNAVYLHIYSFGENTYNEVIRYLDDYKNESRLIIDLRDNGGGYQTAVENIAGLFLPQGTVMMRQIYTDQHEEKFETRSHVYYDNFTYIDILINENTASASEVLTMALREQHPHTTLVGTTSYGKGVVQTTYPLRDGSALKLTTSKWLSPQGVWINKVGIKPDIEIKLDEALTHLYGKFPVGEVFHEDQVSPFIQSAALALRFMDYQLDRTDGYFSTALRSALSAYQRDKGLAVTGELNQESYESLVSGVYRVWNFDKQKDLQLQAALKDMATK